MKIGIISDEICKDFKEALDYGIKWDISHYEIRELGSGRIPYADEEEIKEVINLKNSEKITITALSPGIFKASLADKEIIDIQRKQWIFDTFKLADRLKTNKIIIFGIERHENEPEENFQQVLDLMGEMSENARKNGFIICVENEPDHWFDTGENSVKVLKEIDSKFLRANWDPGNSLTSGENPFPDGYNYIKEYIANLHIKDYVKNEDGNYTAVPAGEGVIDWKGQLVKVLEDLTLETITIETHCTPLIEKSEKSLRYIKSILEDIAGNQPYNENRSDL